MSEQPPYPPPSSRQPYPQEPPGQNPYGGPGYAAPTPAYDYAGWGARVGAYLIDALLSLAASALGLVGYVWFFATLETTSYSDGTSTADYDGGPVPILLMVVGFLIAVAFWVWNICIRQGRTGQSLGKSNLGLRLVKESTGQPMGAGLSFVRQLAHYVDGLCYIGYLWPLWDAKRQTFADKIMSTVVIRDH